MHGDFSRLTFSPAKHFSAVLSQQGRVQVDADANEATQILLHYLRTLTADLLGPAAGPVGDTGNGGFEIGSAVTGNLPDLTISAGRYYVDGLLCENDPGIANAQASYWGQPDAYLDPDRKTDQLPGAPFLVYLLAWERLITAAEDPAIREIALGDQAPDTTARTKLVWQVRAVPASEIFLPSDKVPKQPDPLGVGKKLRAWIEKLRGNPPQLRARARQPDPASADPCITPPQARYRGLENQLYRVEVHTGNGQGPTGSAPTSTPATFTWSRENGSVIFPIMKIDKTEVFVELMGRDKRLGLEVGDWVEVIDDATAFRFEPTTLLQVTDLNIADRIVTLSAAPAPPAGQDTSRHPLLRRWDQQQPHGGDTSLNIPAQDPGDNALQIHEGVTDTDWIDLEDGIQIQFQPSLDANPIPRTYWRGDYWLIPARTLTGDVEWPQGNGAPAWLPPFGVKYHVAPLAIVNSANKLTDQRCLFNPSACQPRQ
jgi:hypothetical protein